MLSVTPQSVSRVVDDLDQRGLTARRPDVADRRRSVVAATAKGRRIALAARQRKIAYLADYLGTLEPTQRRVVQHAISILAPILNA